MSSTVGDRNEPHWDIPASISPLSLEAETYLDDSNLRVYMCVCVTKGETFSPCTHFASCHNTPHACCALSRRFLVALLNASLPVHTCRETSVPPGCTPPAFFPFKFALPVPSIQPPSRTSNLCPARLGIDRTGTYQNSSTSGHPTISY
jgi:hypothetical protein